MAWPQMDHLGSLRVSCAAPRLLVWVGWVEPSSSWERASFALCWHQFCGTACPVIEQDHNLWTARKEVSGMLVGASARVTSASVSSGRAYQVAHSDFLPCPTKVDTVSQPVMTWEICRACSCFGPSEAYELADSRRLSVGQDRSYHHAQHYTTLVSTVWTIIFWWPRWAAWATCTIKRGLSLHYFKGLEVWCHPAVGHKLHLLHQWRSLPSS